MDPNHMSELARLADHLENRREAILARWRNAIQRDPTLTAGEALPRTQLNDHIPAVLAAFEDRLRAVPVTRPSPAADSSGEAAAHGLHRWQQGYDLREVARELGLLNEVMVAELDAYAAQQASVAREVIDAARRLWAAAHTRDVEESTAEFFRLQRVEAAGHVKDLEQALQSINELDQQRAELWRQIAHDLRSNVSVVASATYGLQRNDAQTDVREKFVRMLDRNVRVLRHLLDDVSDLAKLHAGNERRQLTRFDCAAVLSDMCDGLQAFAQERGLYLRTEGPAPMTVEGDALKVRRIAQNLILNALKYTHQGGVTVTWSEGEDGDHKRWKLSIADTGPGFQSGPGAPMTKALKDATELAQAADTAAAVSIGSAAYTEPLGDGARPAPAMPQGHRPAHQSAGEGLGLSIVKRLSELLDASVEVESEAGVGTTFRVLFPLQYSP